MHQADFLSRSRDRLSQLTNSRYFIADLSQLRAKTLLSELGDSSDARLPAFTYDETRLWRSCQFALGSISREVLSVGLVPPMAQSAARLAAETAEYLAQSAVLIDQSTALLTSSLLYHLAGYEASGICMARELLSRGSNNSIGYLDRNIARFLLRHFATLRDLSIRADAVIRDDERDLEARLTRELAGVDEVLALAAEVHMYTAMRQIAEFGLRGSEETYRASLGELNQSIDLFSQMGDIGRSNIATGLLAAFSTLHQRSTWFVLREHGLANDDLWQDYLLGPYASWGRRGL